MEDSEVPVLEGGTHFEVPDLVRVPGESYLVEVLNLVKGFY